MLGRQVDFIVMAERIELTIHISDYPDNWRVSPALWECWIVGKLKDAGIPVEGKLVFRGIKRGSLTQLCDPKDFGASKYVWEP